MTNPLLNEQIADGAVVQITTALKGKYYFRARLFQPRRSTAKITTEISLSIEGAMAKLEAELGKAKGGGK